MSKLPLPLKLNPSFGAPSPSPTGARARGLQPAKDRRMASADQLVLDLCDPELRENALLDLSKVATFIVQKILLDDVGLRYICATADRFHAVDQVLGSMVALLVEQPSSRLLKHIIHCYLRLSEHPRMILGPESDYNSF